MTNENYWKIYKRGNIIEDIIQKRCRITETSKYANEKKYINIYLMLWCVVLR